jgi:hypothetical protein
VASFSKKLYFGGKKSHLVFGLIWYVVKLIKQSATAESVAGFIFFLSFADSVPVLNCVTATSLSVKEIPFFLQMVYHFQVLLPLHNVVLHTEVSLSMWL